MTIEPHTLRRYVIERASGRTPRHEYAFYEPRLGVWIRCDEMTARRHEHHRRIRIEGRPWCEVMGLQTAVADDFPLQTYFLTITPDDWPHLAVAVHEHPARCLRDWRDAGSRIIAAVSDVATSPTPETPGPLDSWPAARGTGQRSMLPR
ncbi:hypothetical protein [Bradyrhizobium sp. SZCCHNPS2010]|uniref:hypothetical protein n=1 Tax=Bradyrhizobium sp. SZCCHNPS2010 TaxID=3057333 RepID=UPI002915F3ED|nr:hypothetical protein [Bradyrhizobium sp. SZCCHNPS2010]